jgi:hypothetical protein
MPNDNNIESRARDDPAFLACIRYKYLKKYRKRGVK